MLQRSGARARGRRSGALGVSLLVALGIVAAACVPVAPPPLPPTLEISTTPGMFPAFNPSSTDYVSRCNGTLTVSIGAPEGTAVSVNYQPWQAGFVDQTLSLADGQSRGDRRAAAERTRGGLLDPLPPRRLPRTSRCSRTRRARPPAS